MHEAVVTLRDGKPVDIVFLEGRDPVPFVLEMVPKLQGTAEIGVCEVKDLPVKCTAAPRVFNNQLKASGGLLMGSADSSVQTSCRVRPHSMTIWKGQRFQPGELRAVDLSRYRENAGGYSGANLVLSWFYSDSYVFRPSRPTSELEDVETVLYRIHQTTSVGHRYKRLDYGWMLTDVQGTCLRRLEVDGPMMSRKHAIMDFAQSVLTRAHANYRPLVKFLDGKVVELAPSLLACGKLGLECQVA